MCKSIWQVFSDSTKNVIKRIGGNSTQSSLERLQSISRACLHHLSCITVMHGMPALCANWSVPASTPKNESLLEHAQYQRWLHSVHSRYNAYRVDVPYQTPVWYFQAGPFDSIDVSSGSVPSPAKRIWICITHLPGKFSKHQAIKYIEIRATLNLSFWSNTKFR